MNEPIVITAFGVSRKSSEWAKLPVCVVSEVELIRRIGLGVQPEVAITNITVPNLAGSSDKHEATTYETRNEEGRPARFSGHGQGKKKHSMFTGVTRRKAGLYYAQIRVSREKVKHLGEFNTEIEAAVAYDLHAIKIGKRNRNFPKLSVAQLEQVAERAGIKRRV